MGNSQSRDNPCKFLLTRVKSETDANSATHALMLAELRNCYNGFRDEASGNVCLARGPRMLPTVCYHFSKHREFDTITRTMEVSDDAKRKIQPRRTLTLQLAPPTIWHRANQ